MNGRWTRVGLAYLTVIDLVTGIWAVSNPAAFYRTFPGFGRHWVSASPPYSHHLVVDAGAGFLAVGVILALATWHPERRLVQAALVGSLAHDLPHFLYHAMHPAAALSGVDTSMSTGGLAFGCVVAGALLIASVAERRLPTLREAT